MTLVILTILILAYVLIATENVTKVNRAAVAIFAGTVGWVLYMCFGMDFVTSEHLADYSRFLHLARCRFHQHYREVFHLPEHLPPLGG